MLVFKEPHQTGQNHYHCVLVARSKTMAWGRIDAFLAEDQLKCDVRIAHTGERAVSQKQAVPPSISTVRAGL